MIRISPAGTRVRTMHATALVTMAVTALMLLLFTTVASAAPTPTTGAISGKVTDQNGKAITTQTVCVEASEPGDGGGFGTAFADSTGAYTITGLSPGSYDVDAYECETSTPDHSPASYSTGSDGSPTVVAVTAGSTQNSINIEMPASTSISGHVYGGAGAATPVSDVCVEASDANQSGPDYAGSSTTASDGSYTVTVPVTTTGYKVQFQPSCSSSTTYVAQYYNNAEDFTSATTVTPTQASPATGIDAHLGTGAAISGSVTDAAGKPITSQDICVAASTSSGTYTTGTYGSATTDASGNYTISGLQSGSYYVSFTDCSGSTRNDVPQYYGGSYEEYNSSLVVLSASGHQTGVNAKMAAGATISGHAYAGSGTGSPLQNICVDASGSDPAGDYASGYGQTAADGSYTISHVVPGLSYQIWFYDCNTPVTYVSQYYGGTYDSSTAVAVTPTVASPVTGADAHLQVGGSLTGRVLDPSGTPITSGVCVDAELESDTSYYSGYADTLSSSTGTYTIGGLPTGTYDLSYYDCSESRNDVSQYLTGLSVTAPSSSHVPDVTMPPGTSISGHVYGGTDTTKPLADVCVEAISTGASSAGDYSADQSGFTDDSGAYIIEHLDPTQSYTVEFNTCDDSGNGYGSQYYNGVSDPSKAETLSPTVSTPSTGIDAHLPLGATTTITGGPAANAATNQTTAEFTFTSTSSGATLECSLDGGSFSACSSPYSTPTLSAGTHSFTVESVSGAVTETDPPSVVWTVNPAAPTSTSQGEVQPGQTFSSNPDGTTSATNPVIVDVTPPASAQITLTSEPVTTPSPNGYSIFGQQLDIAAADPSGTGSVTGTVANPIDLSFTIDHSQIPAGTVTSSITVTRNGTPAPDCTHDDGTASPDPCVESRSTDSSGNLTLEVLTTHCSTWNFADAGTTSGTGGSGGSGGSGGTGGSGGSTGGSGGSGGSTGAGGGSTGGGSNPGSGGGRTPTGPAIPSRATILAALRSLLVPTGKAGKITALLKTGYVFRFAAPAAGRLSIAWYAAPAVTHKGKAAKPALVATATVSPHGAGAVSVRLKLTTAGRRLLAKAKQVKLTVRVVFTPTGGAAASTLTKTVTVKR